MIVQGETGCKTDERAINEVDSGERVPFGFYQPGAGVFEGGGEPFVGGDSDSHSLRIEPYQESQQYYEWYKSKPLPGMMKKAESGQNAEQRRGGDHLTILGDIEYHQRSQASGASARQVGKIYRANPVGIAAEGGSDAHSRAEKGEGEQPIIEQDQKKLAIVPGNLYRIKRHPVGNQIRGEACQREEQRDNEQQLSGFSP